MSKHSSYQAKVADRHGHIDYSAPEHRRWARLYRLPTGLSLQAQNKPGSPS